MHPCNLQGYTNYVKFMYRTHFRAIQLKHPVPVGRGPSPEVCIVDRKSGRDYPALIRRMHALMTLVASAMHAKYTTVGYKDNGSSDIISSQLSAKHTMEIRMFICGLVQLVLMSSSFTSASKG